MPLTCPYGEGGWGGKWDIQLGASALVYRITAIYNLLNVEVSSRPPHPLTPKRFHPPSPCRILVTVVNSPMGMVNLPLVEGTSNLPQVVTPGNSLRDTPRKLDTLKLVSMYCQCLNQCSALVGASSAFESTVCGTQFYERGRRVSRLSSEFHSSDTVGTREPVRFTEHGGFHISILHQHL